MKKIFLSGKYVTEDFKFVMVDDEDYERLSKSTWSLFFNKYYKKGGKNVLREKPYPRIGATINKKKVYMHRLLIDCPKGKQVDHIDGNPLNNQKNNLRIVTPKQNSLNKASEINSSSKFLGVHWREDIKKWSPSIHLNGKWKGTGFYEKEIDAAEARDLMALKYYGEYSRLNFPEKKDYYISQFHTIDLKKERVYSSSYIGVSWCKVHKKWICGARINKKRKNLGYFEDELAAAQKYDEFIVENHLNRKLNFPIGDNNG